MSSASAARAVAPSSPWGPGAQRARALKLLTTGLLATKLAALGCAGLFLALDGKRGLGSALLAAAVVIVCFGIGQGVQVVVAHLSPMTVLFASMAAYLVPMVGLGVALKFALPWAAAGVVNKAALVVTLLVCVFAWLAATITAFSRLNFPVYDAEYEAPKDTEEQA